MNAQSILAQLSDPSRYAVTVVDCTASTNSDLKARAVAGAPEGEILIARTQTAGRGRLGRSFYSPGATGIYCSILLRPRLTAQDALYLTTAAAVAIAQAVFEVCHKDLGIKWVNDLFWEGRKVCGILTEGAPTSDGATLAYAVVGFGLNLCAPKDGFPPELAEIATALYGENEVCPDGVAQRLCARIIERFFALYDALPDVSFLDEYRRRSTVLGKEVRCERGEESFVATVVDIDECANLRLRLADGSERTVGSGEISLRPTQG